MDIEGRRQSSNVEDRRGMRPVRTGVGLSLGGIVFLFVLSLLGINPLPFLGMATKAPQVEMQQTDQPVQETADEAEKHKLTAVVLAETEATWNKIFQQSGMQYVEPQLVLYTEATPTGCGTGQAAMGPFYCPQDQKVYLDMSFYNELESRFGAPGDFAQGYVIAHEVGHHVQNLLGTAKKVHDLQERNSRVANELSVRMELQADCYAGVWAKDADQSRQFLNPGDLEEGLRAATAIGDDRLQRQAQGRVVPDSFTHGTSEQRSRWFRRGFDAGSPDACDTFAAQPL
jgi:uncharacterized protein